MARISGRVAGLNSDYTFFFIFNMGFVVVPATLPDIRAIYDVWFGVLRAQSFPIFKSPFGVDFTESLIVDIGSWVDEVLSPISGPSTMSGLRLSKAN
jgi:hypothetical protein